MECLNCGVENADLICYSCLSFEALDLIYKDISKYNKEEFENIYIEKFVGQYENNEELYEKIPEMFALFDGTDRKIDLEYFWCRYYGLIKDDRFEELAKSYLEKHSGWGIKKQQILYDLLKSYLRFDFKKPEPWSNFIMHEDGLAFELYFQAAEYYSFIGDYDKANYIIEKAVECCEDEDYNTFLMTSRDEAKEKLEKLRNRVIYYRTKRPYWPNSIERRKVMAKIYDKKGISYPRISYLPKGIKESEFEAIEEAEEIEYSNYSSYWCSYVDHPVKPSIKVIYEIAAIKVRDDKQVDEFQSYIYPWDGKSARTYITKSRNIDLEILEKSEDVDIVMKKFFEFVGEDILVSTDALGDQALAISRAARYTRIYKIENLFLDLLDYAADISEKFDMENNSREYLLDHFNLIEGENGLEKVRLNIEIYEKLKELDK